MVKRTMKVGDGSGGGDDAIIRFRGIIILPTSCIVVVTVVDVAEFCSLLLLLRFKK